MFLPQACALRKVLLGTPLNNNLILHFNLLQAIVLSLAYLAEVHDSSPVTNSTRPVEVAQQQQCESSTGTDLAEATLPAEPSSGQVSTEPAAEACHSTDAALIDIQALVLSRIQQDMVYLTMLLSSRNLWMRPAVLEAPAQDPQYLEAIHKVHRALAGTARLLQPARSVYAWQYLQLAG